MNEFLVGVGMGDDSIRILNPPLVPISKERALRLAAWLVTLADPLNEHFTACLDEVQNGDES